MKLRNLVLTLGFLAASASAQDPAAAPYVWKNVKIVAGGFITGLVFHPAEKGLLYARTDIGGAYRWDNASQSWTPLTDWVSPGDSNLLGIESIGLDPTDPNRLYLALGTYTQSWAGTGAIARSADRGATFQITRLPIKLGGNEDGRFAGERLAVDPLNPSRLYFGSRNDGLWTSSDSAVTWSKVASFPANAATNGIGLVSLVFDNINPGDGSEVIYVAASSSTTGLYRSKDSGKSWEPVPGQPTGLLPNHAVLSPDGTIYLTYGNQPGPNNMTNGAVEKYSPKDGSWTNITPGSGITWGFGDIAVDAQNPKTIMVSTMDRWGPIDDLFRSTDAGATWKSTSARSKLDISLSPWLTFGAAAPKFGWWIGALALDPFDSNHVLYGTGATIYATKNVTDLDNSATVQWSVGANGLEETAVLQLISPGSGPHLISGLGDIGGFAHDDLNTSPPSGMFTNPVFSSTSGLDFAEQNPSFVARVGSGNAKHGAYSTDGGHAWTPFTSEAPGAANGTGYIAVSADGKSLLWSPSSGTLAYSADLGKTWTASTGAPSKLPIAADRVNPAKFYAYDASSGIVYASKDEGATFAAVMRINLHDSSARTPRAVPAIEGDIWLPLYAGLFHSTDSGATFTKVAAVEHGIDIGFGKPATDGGYPALYLSGQINGTLGIYRSLDAGATWTRINDDAHQYGYINLIAGDPRVFGRVYLGSNGRGIIYGDLQSNAPLPKINAVVNGASFAPNLQSGAWTTITGENLSSTTRIWTASDFTGNKLPLSLDDVRVTINNRPAAVYFISPTQINALAPADDTLGPVQVTVQTSAGQSAPATAQLVKENPALFLLDPQNRKYPAAVATDGTIFGPPGLYDGSVVTRPAKPGDTVQLFGTACGPTNPPVDPSLVFTGAAPVVGTTTASIGGKDATVTFAGMTGAGLCQFNLIVPNVDDGDQPLSVTVDNIKTNDGVYLNIKHQ